MEKMEKQHHGVTSILKYQHKHTSWSSTAQSFNFDKFYDFYVIGCKVGTGKAIGK